MNSVTYTSSVSEVRTNLTGASTAFLGRVEALQALDARLAADAWLVTLVGPAGTGKTRLAARWAELNPREGGAWFCDLTEARDVDSVCGAVARALSVPIARAKRSSIRSGPCSEFTAM